MLLSGILPQESPNYKDPEKCGAALCRRGEETIFDKCSSLSATNGAVGHSYVFSVHTTVMVEEIMT